MTAHVTRRTMLASLSVTLFSIAAGHLSTAGAFERQNVSCELEDLTRLISLRTDPEAGYVCDVLYEKPDEGNTREVLWSARNNADYCEPRFTKLVEQLASRGWICGPQEASSEPDDQPAIAAAQARGDSPDAETVAGEFRDWCITDVTSGESGKGPGSVTDFCACIADGMASYQLSDDEMQAVITGLPGPSTSKSGDAEANPPRDKRLNTIAVNYEYVVESCR